ncbi:MAG: hypothetical protein ACJ8FI_02805 [Sphingomicrobium sp.]
MTATSVKSVNAGQASLPQLSGRLLGSYRIVWSALALAAVVASGIAALQFASSPAVVGLRLVKSAVLVCVAAILLYRRQRDPVAALLALAFLAWTITSSFDFGTSAEFAQLLDRIRFVLFTLALLLFPDARWQPGWTRSVAAASAGAFLIGVGEALHLLPTHLFLPIAIACVLAAIGSLVVRFCATENYALKQQLKWVALGLVAGVGLILCARAGSAAPAVRLAAMPILWEALFQLGIIIVALGFLVSLLRYRLFDAETVISRSAVYAALTIALVATFGGTEAAIQNLGQAYLGMNIGSVSGAMAAAVAAVLLNPLHGQITEWAERRFQPDLVLLKREVPDIIARLAPKGSARQLASAVLPRINAAIHATHSALLLGGRIAAATGLTMREAQHWARANLANEPVLANRKTSDPLFPLRLRLGTFGSDTADWLLLGPRPDGTLYGREDLDAVQSTFPAFEQALNGARAREAIAAAINRREKLLRTEIGQIHARLYALEGSRTAGWRRQGTLRSRARYSN